MDILAKNLRTLSEIEFPQNLHGNIMRRITHSQFRAPFIVVVALLAVNLAASGWHAWTRIVETESVSIVAAMLNGFEVSADFLRTFVQNSVAFLPLTSILIFLVNLILLVTTARCYRKLQRLPFPKGRNT